jgi:hypothetical protein
MCDGMTPGSTSFITDDTIPQINTGRPFMFVNPFYIKINRMPEISACYNYLINHTSWPKEPIGGVNDEEFFHFQLSTMSVDRSISRRYNNRYVIRILCSPITPEAMYRGPRDKYVEGPAQTNPEFWNNNLRLVLTLLSKEYGPTGYVEMYPIHISEGGMIEFEGIVAVHDNLLHDNTLEVDLSRTEGISSLLLDGPKLGSVIIDATQTLMEFRVLIKSDSAPDEPLYGNQSFLGWNLTNVYENDSRDLELYKPMTMMRSVLQFAGNPKNYIVRANLMPFIKWDLPLDEEKMAYFCRAFTEQYAAVEPVLFHRLDNNSTLDFKLFNTYGKSNNYYIGDPDSTELLDSVHIRISFVLSVMDRSTYQQTAQSVTNEIKRFFEVLNTSKLQNIHISNLIHLIEQNHPNVNYLRFLGINDYDANLQSIRVKYDHIDELREDQLQIYVPEMIQVHLEDIIIHEEV